jgi:hypothetical protein
VDQIVNYIDDARTIWHRLWSIRLALLAAALNAALVVATMVLPEHTSLRVAGAVGVLAFSSAVASAYARVVKQPALSGDGHADRDA